MKCFVALAAILNLGLLTGFADEGCRGPQQGRAWHAERYAFTSDYFSANIPVWEKALREFKGRSGIRYLEIGVFEGGSLFWMLENILTHPSAKATGIDTFYTEDYTSRFYANLKASGLSGKVKVLKGRSQAELRNLPFNSFDIIYVDGSHTADDVLADAVLSWPLLKDKGMIIFDDYLLYPGFSAEHTPKLAIDAFMAAYRNHITETVYSGYQIILRKKESPEVSCRPFGQYVYVWGLKRLYLRGTQDDKSIPLSERECKVIESFIKAKKSDNDVLPVDSAILRDKDFIALKKKIKLDLGCR